MVFNFCEEINYFGKGKRFLKKGTKFFFNKEEEEMPQQIKFTNFIKKNGNASIKRGNASTK